MSPSGGDLESAVGMRYYYGAIGGPYVPLPCVLMYLFNVFPPNQISVYLQM